MGEGPKHKECVRGGHGETPKSILEVALCVPPLSLPDLPAVLPTGSP
jgi:hypothetical protein